MAAPANKGNPANPPSPKRIMSTIEQLWKDEYGCEIFCPCTANEARVLAKFPRIKDREKLPTKPEYEKL